MDTKLTLAKMRVGTVSPSLDRIHLPIKKQELFCFAICYL